MWFENAFLLKKKTKKQPRFPTQIVASDSGLGLAVTLLSSERPTGKFVAQM